jgi:hypothetical protein
MLVCPKKNAPWFGKVGQNSTIWDVAQIHHGLRRREVRSSDAKPVDLMRRPAPSGVSWCTSRFLGSGTTLAAANSRARLLWHGARSKYVDVIQPATVAGLSGKRTAEATDTVDEMRSETISIGGASVNWLSVKVVATTQFGSVPTSVTWWSGELHVLRGKAVTTQPSSYATHQTSFGKSSRCREWRWRRRSRGGTEPGRNRHSTVDFGYVRC